MNRLNHQQMNTLIKLWMNDWINGEGIYHKRMKVRMNYWINVQSINQSMKQSFFHSIN